MHVKYINEIGGPLRRFNTAQSIYQQEALEKCWVHSPLRAAARPFTRCRHCRTPPAHRRPRRQQQRQRQRVTEGTIEWAQKLNLLARTLQALLGEAMLKNCSLISHCISDKKQAGN